jgi:ribosome-associated translation inhibitor RaiA
MNLRVHFHGMHHSANLHSECEHLCEGLGTEFPEALRFEVTLRHDASQYETIVHVTGKEIDLAAHASGPELRPLLTEAFERARRQLRKHHDKLVFERRRKAARE